MAVNVFLDTSVLLTGLVDFGPQSAPAQRLMHGIAEKTTPNAGTAWHCCLEFFSVATRLPEFRLSLLDATRLVEDEVFARMAVLDLSAAKRLPLFKAAATDAVAGGRIYDAYVVRAA